MCRNMLLDWGLSRNMRRRDFLTALGGAAALWPLLAQTPAVPVIGFLNAQKSADFGHVVQAFHRGLNEGGFVEGQNVNIEYRWAEGRYDRLAPLAADLVGRHVTVIAATGGDASARAAKAATTEIPVVFAIGGDPVELGFVASFNRPGGNVTGMTQYTAALEGKRLELLHELMPDASEVAMLVDPGNPNIDVQLKELPTAAHKMNMQLTIFRAATEREIDDVRLIDRNSRRFSLLQILFSIADANKLWRALGRSLSRQYFTNANLQRRAA